MFASKIQMIIAGAALLVALGAGVQIGSWKKGAEFLLDERELRNANDALVKDIGVLSSDNAALKAAIQEQSSAVTLLESQTQAAKDIQAEAQKRADGLQIISKKRLDKIEALIPNAKTCDDILIPYWSARQ